MYGQDFMVLQTSLRERLVLYQRQRELCYVWANILFIFRIFKQAYVVSLYFDKAYSTVAFTAFNNTYLSNENGSLDYLAVLCPLDKV